MSQYSFSSVPVIKHRRSQFDLSHIVKTSGNVGTLYPLDVQEVYPGDSFKTDLSIVSRLTSTFLKPVIDNLFLDVYHFFVPSRILYDKWKNIFGENTQSAWANSSEYEVPLVYGSNSASNFITVYSKTVGDYLGLPVSPNPDLPAISRNVPVSVLPFRAFAKIYDDWFRDQNNVSPMHVQTGETVASEKPNFNDWAPNNYFGKCPKVAKLHDYFTSCLPAPQKRMEGVSIPLSADFAPVVTRDVDAIYTSFDQPAFRFGLISETGSLPATSTLGLSQGSSPSFGTLRSYPTGASGTPNYGVVPLNLWADMSGAGGNVADLRLATQMQRIFERDARSGSRYIEYLRAAFGVSAPNAELQRSEFLGGKRIPISITQVTQTTGSNSEASPLADVGAYSLSGGRTRYNKGFTEHGYVLTVFCVRQFHTYQQGIERFWTRHKRFDFFDPAFSNLSEQPVYKSELYAFGEANDVDRQVFGYQEAWADLRCRQNKITGQLRSAAGDKLDMWHFGDYYANAPTLNPGFIEETPQYVDRAITVESSKQDQFLFDFYFKTRAYRTLPVYSVPGLVDHN